MAHILASVCPGTTEVDRPAKMLMNVQQEDIAAMRMPPAGTTLDHLCVRVILALSGPAKSAQVCL